MPTPRRDCQHCKQYVRLFPFHHRLQWSPKKYMGCELYKGEKCEGKCTDFQPVMQGENMEGGQ